MVRMPWRWAVVVVAVQALGWSAISYWDDGSTAGWLVQAPLFVLYALSSFAFGVRRPRLSSLAAIGPVVYVLGSLADEFHRQPSRENLGPAAALLLLLPLMLVIAWVGVLRGRRPEHVDSTKTRCP